MDADVKQTFSKFRNQAILNCNLAEVFLFVLTLDFENTEFKYRGNVAPSKLYLI